MDEDDASSSSPSMSPSHRISSALPVADPVTVAAAGPPAPSSGLLALALPIQKQHAASSGREDAWSEGATAALIEAWGERFVALGRGSLRHPQWQEVADAVSSREGYSKAPKSDVQCKNRIDTLKKKYKVEMNKPAPSSWKFFGRLDDLLAPTFANKLPGGGGGGGVNGRGNPVSAALRVGFPQRSRTPLMPAPLAAVAAAKRRAPPSPEPSASYESSDGFPPEREPAIPLPFPPPNGKRSRVDDGGGGDRAQGLRELAQAIRRFGEAYERVETAKLEQAAEMERRRLDFASELESQRVQFFVNTQMELSQVKNRSSSPAAAPPATTAGGSSRRMASVNDAGGSGNYHRRYRVSESSRHRHHHPPPRPHYQYHENNVAAVAAAATAAASDGEQSDDEEGGDEDEESQ